MRIIGRSNRYRVSIHLDNDEYIRVLTQLGQEWEDNQRYVRPHQIRYDELSNFGMW